MLERVLGVPIPRDEVFAAAERLLDRLADVHRLLSDPDRTSVRITLALDKLSVAEARRSYTYFHLFGYPSDMVIANRVLPEDAGPYFAKLREAQQRYLPIVEQEFGPVPVRTVPQFDHEMVGRRPAARDRRGAVRRRRSRPRSTIAASPIGSAARTACYVLQVELPFTQQRRAAAVAPIGRARAAGRRLAADAAPAAGAGGRADEGREDGRRNVADPVRGAGQGRQARRTTMTEPTTRQPPTPGRGPIIGWARRTNALPSSRTRLARLEGAPGLRERGRSLMDRVMPAEASEHFRNADARASSSAFARSSTYWIDRLDEADERAAGRSRERETIEIE